VVLALPIAGERGHIVQVLIASVSLEPVRETLGVLARDRQMAYLLTDGNGLPLARDGWPVSVAEAGFAGLPSLRAALTRRAGHLEYRDQLDGTDWLAGYAPVARSRWTMTVAAPAGAVVGTAADGHMSQTLALAAAMLTALAAAIIISGRLAARVQALASSAQAAADDESPTPAPAGDELQQLARAIANLSSNLAVSRRNQHTQAAQLQHLVRRVADAQEEERRRIAVDLHDGASQLVVAAQYEAFACKRALDDGRPEVAARRLAQTQQLLTEALGELHRVVFDLRPKVLEELGLQGALEHHLGYLNESSDTTWTLETIGAPIVLPSETELAIYRIVQEALNNARRHARAREVHVTLRLTPQTGTFGALVEDDGCGFEPAIPLHDPHQHLGLRAMRDRAAQVGGTLQLETRQGGGMRVSLSVPTQWPMASSDPAPLHGVGGLAWRPDVAAT
jgi:signal transduction histidine kinase